MGEAKSPEETSAPNPEAQRVDIKWENPIYDDDAWRPSYGENSAFSNSFLDAIRWLVEQGEAKPKSGSLRSANASPFRLDGWALPVLAVVVVVFVVGIAWLNGSRG